MSVNRPIPQDRFDYDICSASIQCNADKAGAQVFEVFQHGNPKPCRVLDFSAGAAAITFADWVADVELEGDPWQEAV